MKIRIVSIKSNDLNLEENSEIKEIYEIDNVFNIANTLRVLELLVKEACHINRKILIDVLSI